jgi:hypothetical protein
VDVEKVPVGSSVREKPVSPVAAIGLTPMSPTSKIDIKKICSLKKAEERTYREGRDGGHAGF